MCLYPFPETIPQRKNHYTCHHWSVDQVFLNTIGLLKVVQNDQGTTFFSKAFRQTLQWVGVSPSVSSAYHPETQGALEHWHQTLKSMFGEYCLETGKDWDKGVPLILYAIRDAKPNVFGSAWAHYDLFRTQSLWLGRWLQTCSDPPLGHCTTWFSEFQTHLVVLERPFAQWHRKSYLWFLFRHVSASSSVCHPVIITHLFSSSHQFDIHPLISCFISVSWLSSLCLGGGNHVEEERGY